MDKKIIKSKIRRKFNQWVASIEDEQVRELVKNHTIITGGCITSMLLNEEVNDYDVYFSNYETVEAVARYYVALWKKVKGESPLNDITLENINGKLKIFIQSDGIKEDDDSSKNKWKTPFHPTYFTDNAITLSDGIQIIIRFHGDPAEIHKNFDYVHCTNYWESKTRKLTYHPLALQSILEKKLYYQGSLYPVCSLFRLRKFISRGWHITGGEMLKIMFQVSKLNLSDREILREQLIGVDTAYFTTLIDALATKEQEIDYHYIISIINRIFDGEDRV